MAFIAVILCIVLHSLDRSNVSWFAGVGLSGVLHIFGVKYLLLCKSKEILGAFVGILS
jgi:hypothetical protein